MALLQDQVAEWAQRSVFPPVLWNPVWTRAAKLTSARPLVTSVGEVLGAGSGEPTVEFWGIMQAGCQTAIIEN